jgi:hypothetical protein
MFFKELLEKFESFDIDKSIDNAMLDYEYDYVLKIQEQLQAGIDGTGKKMKTFGALIGVYSPFTEVIKQSKGQPTDKVTLKDTGDFYRSMEIDAAGNDWNVNAEFDKDDGNIADNVDVRFVLDLTKKNFKKFFAENSYFRNQLQDDARNFIKTI